MERFPRREGRLLYRKLREKRPSECALDDEKVSFDGGSAGLEALSGRVEYHRWEMNWLFEVLIRRTTR